MKKLQTFCAGVIILSILSFNCIYDPTDSFYYDDIYNQEFEYSKMFLETFFVFQDSLPVNPYVYTSVESLYTSVKEPYTWYANSELAIQVLELLSTTTSTAGAGIVIDSINGAFIVVDVTPQSPGQKAGLVIGDTITAIYDTLLAGFSLAVVNSFLTGDVGDSISFRLKQDTVEIDITVFLDFYRERSVKILWLDTNIAYIAIEIFSDSTCLDNGTAQEFREALFITENSTYTIIDLRDNPGGQLSQCIQICSEFVEKETKLVSVWERYFDTLDQAAKFRDTFWLAEERGSGIGRKFYVLMNGSSAGESEILISALRSNRPDIKTVGSKSYGKGRGQIAFFTPDSGLAFVTFGIIASNDGVVYDMIGIEPNIPINATQDALIIALADIDTTGSHSGGMGNQMNRINRMLNQRKTRKISNSISLYVLHGNP